MSNSVLDVKATETETKTGLDREERLELSKQLGVVLADSYQLYAETQGVHWNIVGPMFYSVHKLTEGQYEDLADSIDEIAERIRALGFKSPAGLKTMAELSSIDSNIDYSNSIEMVEALVEDNDALSRSIREVVKTAEQCDDVKTADLLTERIGKLEENAWMLRALITQ